jgi:hypothetical protein
MLHLIRTWGVEKRWVFGIVFGGVALMFVFSMGWMGMSAPIGVYAAKVNGTEILTTHFNRAYQSRYKEMEKLYGDQFNEELVKTIGLRQQVVMGMVDELLWLTMAAKNGLHVSDGELASTIKEFPSFQVNNRFNTAHYKRVLSRAGMSPEAFENSVRQGILNTKAQDLVRASVQVTDADLLPYAEPEDAELAADELTRRDDQRKVQIKRMKQAQMMTAYVTQMRAQADIEIFWKDIGVKNP